jgi:hypothetical protein
VWTGWQKVSDGIERLRKLVADNDTTGTAFFALDELKILIEQFGEAAAALRASKMFELPASTEWMFCADSVSLRDDGWSNLVFARKQQNNGTTYIVRLNGSWR